MNDTILHHHDPSPFAEKIRLIFGLKGLDWHSVEIPMVMPKPDLTALTGGYRKTPVLQIGADIYCDTRLIAVELERRFPTPTLFPNGSKSVALALGYWSDATLFRSGATLSMGTNKQLPDAVLKDRLAFFDFMTEADISGPLSHFFGQFCAGLEQLEQMLGDGRSWLLGESASWADLACYSPVWMCSTNIAGGDALLNRLPAITDWMARVAEIGHGNRHSVTASEALAISHNTAAELPAGVPVTAWSSLTAGTLVSVVPDDYGIDPSVGVLVTLNDHEIAIARQHEAAGDIIVHFPRIGYRVLPCEENDA